MWPKSDSWGGGGLFGSDDHFFLEHDTRIQNGVDQFKLMEGFATPKRFRVQGFREHAPVPACDVEQHRQRRGDDLDQPDPLGVTGAVVRGLGDHLAGRDDVAIVLAGELAHVGCGVVDDLPPQILGDVLSAERDRRR